MPVAQVGGQRRPPPSHLVQGIPVARQQCLSRAVAGLPAAGDG